MAATVLRYFERNPNCVDDLEGIARWRLLDEHVGEMLAETAAALDRLVARGLLVCIDAPGLRPRYRLRVTRGREPSARRANRGAAARSPRRRPQRVR